MDSVTRATPQQPADAELKSLTDKYPKVTEKIKFTFNEALKDNDTFELFKSYESGYIFLPTKTWLKHASGGWDPDIHTYYDPKTSTLNEVLKKCLSYIDGLEKP